MLEIISSKLEGLILASHQSSAASDTVTAAAVFA